MKQITILLAMFMFFSKADAQCFFNLAQNPSVPNQTIRIGTTDTLGSWRMISDSCGATTLSFTFAKYGTSNDSNYTNLYFYKDTTLLFPVPFMAGVTTQVNYATALPAHDTVTFTIIGVIDSTTPIGQTIWFDMNAIVIDSNNIAQVLPVSTGQTFTTTGCILNVKKNPLVVDQTITPGTQKLIGSFRAQAIGCSFTTTYAVLNNLGTCPNNALKNVAIKKGAVQMGSTIPILGANSVILFSDVIPGGVTTLYGIYADVDTSAVDSSTVIIDFNVIATSPTAGYFLQVDSVGQTMTIDNPTPIVITGPCAITTTELPTSLTLPRGTTVCLGSIVVNASNCGLDVNSISFGVYGTAATNYMSNVIIMKNNVTPVAWAIPTMSFFNTVSMNENIPANSSDTFFVTGNLSASALLDNRTYQLDVTVTATDSLGNVKTNTLLLQEKTIVDGPNAIPSIYEKLISVYPNPATDYLIVEGFTGEIEITDIIGNVYTRKFVSEKEKINIQNIPSGIYILKSQNYRPAKFTKE